RQILRPDELLEDRRPRRRRDQVGRHHAARGENGRGRRRSPGHRAIHRLEGAGGAEGRKPRHRLAHQPAAPQGGAESLRQLRGLGRRLLRSRQEPGASPRDQGGAQERRARQFHPPGDPVRQAGLYRHRVPGFRHRLGFGGLSHRLRPELQQFGAGDRRVPQSRRGRRRLGPDLAHQARQGRQDPKSPRAVGEDRARRLGERRSRHAVRLWTIVLEISVLMAQFPSKQIALRSYDYRTLGLGYANIGGLLMSSGIPYDSEAGRAICGAMSAIMTGVSYATSAEMAAELGPFPGYRKNREHMLRVIRNHRRAAYGAKTGHEKLSTPPVPLDHAACPDVELIEHAKNAWDRALTLGEAHGYRNAQSTVIAPTGTIGLVMDCDTTGIEPDFALVKFKKLAGGGYFKIINRAVPEALRVLGYSEA